MISKMQDVNFLLSLLSGGNIFSEDVKLFVSNMQNELSVDFEGFKRNQFKIED